MKRVTTASPDPVRRPYARIPLGDDSIVIRIPTPARLARFAAPMVDMGERLTAAQAREVASLDPDEQRALSDVTVTALEWHEAAMGWYMLSLVSDSDWQIDARDSRDAGEVPDVAKSYPEIWHGRLFVDELHELCDVSALFRSFADAANGRAPMQDVADRATFSSRPEDSPTG